MGPADPAAILLADVYECRHCDAGRFGFASPHSDGPYFKFPATIGAPATADLLFVGINPLRSAAANQKGRKNRALHENAMSSLRAFSVLASNHTPDKSGRRATRYITRYGEEPACARARD